MAGFLYLTIFYFTNTGETWRMLSFFGPMMGSAFLVMLAFEVVFNAIDIRHGVHGVPAGFYPPIALAIVAFSFAASVAFFAVNLPLNGGIQEITIPEFFYHGALLLLPFLDYLFFHVKGNVRLRTLVFWMFVPFFYWIFIYFRALIWPNNPLVGDSLYPYFFMDPASPYYWPGALAAIIYFGGIGLGFVFFGNFLSGKYKKKEADVLD